MGVSTIEDIDRMKDALSFWSPTHLFLSCDEWIAPPPHELQKIIIALVSSGRWSRLVCTLLLYGGFNIDVSAYVQTKFSIVGGAYVRDDMVMIALKQAPQLKEVILDLLTASIWMCQGRMKHLIQKESLDSIVCRKHVHSETKAWENILGATKLVSMSRFGKLMRLVDASHDMVHANPYCEYRHTCAIRG